jgi:hypothetical protein
MRRTRLLSFLDFDQKTEHPDRQHFPGCMRRQRPTPHDAQCLRSDLPCLHESALKNRDLAKFEDEGRGSGERSSG